MYWVIDIALTIKAIIVRIMSATMDIVNYGKAKMNDRLKNSLMFPMLIRGAYRDLPKTSSR